MCGALTIHVVDGIEDFPLVEDHWFELIAPAVREHFLVKMEAGLLGLSFVFRANVFIISVARLRAREVGHVFAEELILSFKCRFQIAWNKAPRAASVAAHLLGAALNSPMVHAAGHGRREALRQERYW